VVPSALDKVLLKELCVIARRCYERGWSFGTAGNFSLRSTQPDLFWQSPTGLCKGELNPDLFLPIRISTGHLASSERCRPSGEMPVHLGVFRAVESARSVVHCHPPGVVRWSKNPAPPVFHGDEMQKHLGCHSHKEELAVPNLVNPTPEEMANFAPQVAEHVKPKVPLIVLAGHGVYAWGKTPMEALSYIEALEVLCATQ
jgi:methylthioribulose-1-phosphate dehydratase